MTPTAVGLLAVMVFVFVGLPLVSDHAAAAQKYVAVEPDGFWNKFLKIIKKIVEIVAQFFDCLDGRQLVWNW